MSTPSTQDAGQNFPPPPGPGDEQGTQFPSAHTLPPETAEQARISAAVPPHAPPAVRDAADPEAAKAMKPSEERSVLDFLLGPATPPEYRTKVKYATPAGEMDLDWHLESLPGKEMTDIERRNTNEALPPGNAQRMDQERIDAETVVAATKGIRDPRGERSTHPKDVEFRTTPGGELIADPAEALQLRFYFQSGIIASLASEVRRISGWGPDRVGTAQRVLADAVGNSSSSAG